MSGSAAHTIPAASSVFHSHPLLHPFWTDVVCRAHGLTLHILEDGDAGFAFYRRGTTAVSLAHDTSLGGLVGGEAKRRALAATLPQRLRAMGVRRAVLRCGDDPALEGLGLHTEHPFIVHRVDLSTGGEPSAHHRRNLKKAQEQPWKLHTGPLTDRPAVQRLSFAASRHFGTPPTPTTLLDAWTAPPRSSPLTAFSLTDGTETLQAVLLAAVGSRDAVYKWGFATPSARTAGAYFLLVHALLEQAREQGLRFVHLGVTAPQAQGLHRFKEGWGATAGPASFLHLVGAPGPPLHRLFPAPRWLRAFTAALPGPLWRRTGQWIY